MIPELTPEEWLEEAVKDGFIIKYEFNEFSKIEVIGTGATGLVHRAFLRKLQNNIALKSFDFSKKFTNKEFVNEVNFVSSIFIYYIYTFYFYLLVLFIFPAKTT